VVDVLYFAMVSVKSDVTCGDDEGAILFPVKVIAKAK